MRRILNRLLGSGFASGTLCGVCLVLVSACVWLIWPSDAPKRHELEGLWEVTSVRNLTEGVDQPNRREYHMFGPSYQMVILAGEGRPRLDMSFSDMTPEQVRSQQPVGAGFYQYEAAGGRIVRTNIAALSAYYEGRTFVGEYEVVGDTLVFRDRHSADGDEREWIMRRVE